MTARTRPIAARARPPVSLSARRAVVSEATGPNTTIWARSASMSTTVMS